MGLQPPPSKNCRFLWYSSSSFSFHYSTTKNKTQKKKKKKKHVFYVVVLLLLVCCWWCDRREKEKDADASTFIIKKTDWIVVGVIDGAVIVTVVIIIIIININIIDERNRGARRETVPLVDDEGKRCASESCERNVCEECSALLFFQWIQRSVAAAYEQQVHEHEHDVAQKIPGESRSSRREGDGEAAATEGGETKEKEGNEQEQEGEEEDDQNEMAEKDALIVELNERHLRTLADMENLRTRTQRQNEDAKKFGCKASQKIY